MRKVLFSIGLGSLMLLPFGAKAQQTLSEATDSIKNILALAKKGDASAQNEVGGWYYKGKHVKQSYTEALQWWTKSAKQGDARAIGNMGLCYETGHGVAADSLKASKLYLRSIKGGNKALFNQNVERANKGNVFSNMLIAACYQNGEGVAKDPSKALPYLKRAADKNSIPAQRDLGLILFSAKKIPEAASWFKKAAGNGDTTSSFYYGKMLVEGTGVKQDKKEGANYLLKAAEGGFPLAMLYVGNCYAEGNGLTRNEEQAVKWYERAAAKGVAKAQWDVAQRYREGNGTAVNYDKALYWYSEAVANGEGNAFRTLVQSFLQNTPFLAYLKGMRAYATKNYDAAIKEFKTVGKAKITDGKVMEAAILANAGYAKHNMKKGVKLLTDAAKSDPQAMYILGGLYEAGKGVDKNMATAVDYFTKSAEAGYGPAECALADIYYEGRGVDQNYQKAVEWYSKADLHGQLTENAAKRYAGCYEDGKGVGEADKDKAEEILKSGHKSRIADMLKLI